MKILDISGKEISVRIDAQKYSLNRTFRSKLQSLTRERLIDKFKYEIILEDYSIPSSHLSIDFFIPRRKIVCEVQGEGHQKWTSFFHGQRLEGKFYKQIQRDSRKLRWCQINNFTLIEIFSEEDLNKIENI